jgi:hypothetical protein
MRRISNGHKGAAEHTGFLLCIEARTFYCMALTDDGKE